MPAWSKRIQGLSIKEENCFLGLVNNELRAVLKSSEGCFQIKVWLLPSYLMTSVMLIVLLLPWLVMWIC